MLFIRRCYSEDIRQVSGNIHSMKKNSVIKGCHWPLSVFSPWGPWLVISSQYYALGACLAFIG